MPPLPAPAAELPPSATLPPTPARALVDTLRSPAAPAARPASRPLPLPAPAAVRTVPGASGAAPSAELVSLEKAVAGLIDEIRSLREGQERLADAVSQLAQSRTATPGMADGPEPVADLIRARNRKTVLLIDDDPQTRAAALAELEQAEIPVRSVDDGNAAVAAIAEEKPDVIVLELGMGGDMGGKDVVNMIKATMEWVDIPIVLWTRESVPNQKEARLVHGADEIVPKSSGPAALLGRVVSLFRRG